MKFELAAEQQDTAQKLEKVFDIFKASNKEIRPHLLLTGPSGAGKSHLAKTLAKKHRMNFIEVNAAQITKEGMSGNSLSRALTPLRDTGGKPTVVLVDEFDKLFITGNSNVGSVVSEATIGVQNEFLHILESDHASVIGNYGHYDQVPCKNVLFIFAGAFNGQLNLTIDDLRGFGLKTEFLGRVGLIYNLGQLSLESMLTLLREHPLLVHYLQLYSDATKEAVMEALTPIVTDRYENNTLGIRMLTTLLHQYFINGGVVQTEDIKTTTFSRKLALAAG